jgi:hypothetical protein
MLRENKGVGGDDMSDMSFDKGDTVQLIPSLP